MTSAETIREAAWHERWLYALKPASWGKLVVPAALGLTIGLGGARAELGTVHTAVALLAWAVAFTFALLVTVVCLNDWGDRRIDTIKRRLFPRDCSPKTIPDAILPARAVRNAGIAAAATVVSLGFVGASAFDRPALVPASAFALAVFVAYTLPPVRLNYRGGGELLEMAGVGVVLPSVMILAVAGERAFVANELGASVLAIVPGWTAAALASAVASGLADEISDRAGGKRTFATMLGNAGARRLVEAALAAAAVWWLLAGSLLAPVLELPPLGVLAALVAGGWTALRSAMLRQHGLGLTAWSFGELGRYKAVLHGTIRGAGWLLAAVAVLGGFRGAW